LITATKKLTAPNIATWIIVPAKPLSKAKSRLANILTPQARQNLAFHLLDHTLQILDLLQKSLINIKVLLVSSDPFLLRLAEKYRLYTFVDTNFDYENDSNARLNKALTQAAQLCATYTDTKSLLVLPADLPFLEVDDLLFLLKQATELPNEKQIIISPDRAQVGTNALFVQPATLAGFDFQFGHASFAAHLEQATNINVPATQILNRPGLLFDLDDTDDFYSLPADLQQQLLAPVDF